jgi:multimeric flavodoxin WrbA
MSLDQSPLSPPSEPRRGSPSPRLDEFEFKHRFRSQFIDPAFQALPDALAAMTDAAWDAYKNSRKAPITRKAGPGYHDPDYDLAEDWINAKAAIDAAQARQSAPGAARRVLVISASSRSEHTCPGEVSKSFRMMEMACETLEADGIVVDRLDLSRIASEYGKNIHPCKACFSTAPQLCHWPCSCYPNYSLGQSQDWMNDIYPLWAGAHGVMIITPVNWYQVSSPLKLMMDRLVCADGGNPDPTLTHGKHADEAKKLELEEGWSYPRHLSGRLFSVIVHGDVEGAHNVRQSVSDWLRFMELVPAGEKAQVDRYIGYWKPYATSHQEFDADAAMQGEVRNAAKTLAEAVFAQRDGKFVSPGSDLHSPRNK